MGDRFVYVRFLGKVFPEKRPRDIPDNGWERGGEVVYSVGITGEELLLPISKLADKYPLPEKTNEEAG